MENLDRIIEKSRLKSSRNSLIGGDPKIIELFEEVLSSIKNINFVQENPNGNVQFIIAQLGPILQKISDQLSPVEKKPKKRINHQRSRS